MGTVAIGIEEGHVVLYFDDGSFIVMEPEKVNELIVALELTLAKLEGKIQ